MAIRAQGWVYDCGAVKDAFDAVFAGSLLGGTESEGIYADPAEIHSGTHGRQMISATFPQFGVRVIAEPDEPGEAWKFRAWAIDASSDPCLTRLALTVASTDTHSGSALSVSEPATSDVAQRPSSTLAGFEVAKTLAKIANQVYMRHLCAVVHDAVPGMSIDTVSNAHGLVVTGVWNDEKFHYEHPTDKRYPIILSMGGPDPQSDPFWTADKPQDNHADSRRAQMPTQLVGLAREIALKHQLPAVFST